MNIKKLKNYFIIFLCFTTVYLTGRLWFEKFSNHNFFYTVLDAFSVKPSQGFSEEYTFVEPFRIITGFGNETYTAIYDNMSKNTKTQLSNQAFKLTLQKGEFIESGKINWNDILDNKFYMLDYTFLVSGDFLFEGFGVKSKDVSNNVDNFTSILIIPSDNHDGILKVFFIDETADLYHQYKIESSTLNQAILKEINDQEEQNSNLFYISSEQTGLDTFNKNVFIPEWIGNGYEYDPIVRETPYAPDGSPLMDFIEPKLDMFFENPEEINSTAADVYTFSDDTTVVKYYPEHIIEYVYYLPDNYENVDISLLSSYYSALDFIEKDKWLLNRYYLDDYKLTENGYIFYFNYTINDFPINFSDDFKTGTKMSHPLEITVEKGKVTKYKKLAFNFNLLTDDTKTAKLDFWGAYDNFIELHEINTNIKIDALSLSYLGDSDESSLLNWFMEINNKRFVKQS